MMIPLEELTAKHKIQVTGIVHVGAHEGQELKSYVDHKVNPVLWIEANPQIYDLLRLNIAPYRHHHCYQFAAYDEDNKVVTLNVMENSMCSSILYPEKHLKLYPHVPVVEKVEVKTKTLDTFFDEIPFQREQFNFLNMDIQGSELLTLKGARSLLPFLDYIYTEINDDYFFKDCCLTSELEEFLSTWGFERIDKRMHPDGWGDAFYARGPRQ